MGLLLDTISNEQRDAAFLASVRLSTKTADSISHANRRHLCLIHELPPVNQFDVGSVQTRTGMYLSDALILT